MVPGISFSGAIRDGRGKDDVLSEKQKVMGGHYMWIKQVMEEESTFSFALTK